MSINSFHASPIISVFDLVTLLRTFKSPNINGNNFVLKRVVDSSWNAEIAKKFNRQTKW